mmetsp:Transcript_23143/g.68275  ORF Transcript_23143/g.68275 Transcript_23143/m.68275 type:complete len:706 (+) Transcript_23143:7512-9629(+)
MALSSARRSASSAGPPRSPLHVDGVEDLKPPSCSLVAADSAEASDKPCEASFFSPFRFHGGNSPDPLFLLDGFFSLAFPRFHEGKSSWLSSAFEGVEEEVGAAPSPSAPVSSSSWNLLSLPPDLFDMALNSASRSASSAAPPRSPVKVDTCLKPPPSGASGTLSFSEDSTASGGGPETAISNESAAAFSCFFPFRFQGRTSPPLLPLAAAGFFFFAFPLFHGGKSESSALGAASEAPSSDATCASVSSASSPPANLSTPVLFDMALSSANKSASSATPPRSPLKVDSCLKPPPSGSAGGGEPATATSNESAPESFSVFPLRFHGGTPSPEPFLLTAFFFGFPLFRGGTSESFDDDSVGVASNAPSMASEPPAASSSSPWNLSPADFFDMALSSASKSASSAAPPRSPWKVDACLKPPSSDSTLGSAATASASPAASSSAAAGGGGSAETATSKESVAPSGVFPLRFHGGTSPEPLLLATFFFFSFPRFHGGRFGLPSATAEDSSSARPEFDAPSLGSSSLSSSPRNLSPPPVLFEMALSSANRSASSAVPPRSPWKVDACLKPPPSGSAGACSTATLLSSDIAPAPEVGEPATAISKGSDLLSCFLSLRFQGGTTSDPLLAAFIFFALPRFHGGKSESSPSVESRTSDGAPSTISTLSAPLVVASSSSSPPANLSPTDLFEMALSAANKSASSAAPPLSPWNVEA